MYNRNWRSATMPTPIQLFLTRKLLEKELQCLYSKLIQNDEDFQATYLYVLAGRGASLADHPADWQEPKLRPVNSFRESSSPYKIGAYIAHNCNLINDVPLTPTRWDVIDIKTNLPIPAINMTKAVYFHRHELATDDLRATSPPYIGKRIGHREFEDYRTLMENYIVQIERGTIERARTITSMIVLANILSDEFKRRCRSITNHFQLEIFFYNSVTDDQLYYVFTDFWSAIDFGSIQVRDTLPNSPTKEDKMRFELRKFTKMTFACLARDYFKYCLQVTRIKKGHNRHDSKQPSEFEEKINEEKAIYQRLCQNIRDYPQINRRNEITRHKEPLVPPDEDTHLITEPPGIEVQDALIPGSTTKSTGRIIFDVEKERKRFNVGMQKVMLEWQKPPKMMFLKDARHFPATANFLVDCNPPSYQLGDHSYGGYELTALRATA